MYPLTPAEIAADRADAIADDAGARLAAIRDARHAALEKIRAAIVDFADAADAQAIHGQCDRHHVREALELADEMLGEIAFRVVHDLEDAELGEGLHEGAPEPMEA